MPLNPAYLLECQPSDVTVLNQNAMIQLQRTPQKIQDHILQLEECLNNLNEKSFWQYARCYGILARNFGHDRIRALTMLLSIYETNEKSAQQLILYLRKAS